MGIFSFIKDVGEKLFGGEAKAAELTPEDKAGEIKKSIESLGLDAKDVEVKVDGDQVTLSGKVKDQETLEKVVLASGNNEGIASVKTDVAVDAPQEESVFYTVKKGDTLWKIAEMHYGKGKGAKYSVIFEANRPMLKDPDKIYPGQVLRIPKL